MNLVARPTLTPARAWYTEQQAPLFRVPKRMEEEILRRLASDFYGAAAPGEIREVAARLGMGATTWWRRTSGTEPTPLSRVGEDALRFRRAGYSIGFFPAYIDTVALLPDLERLTLAQANDALVGAHKLEDQSNAGLNRYQTLHLADGEPCFLPMAIAAMDQSEKSTLVARLALRLHLLLNRVP